MYSLFSIICAVSLSLASTNDYIFTVPGTTNLIGRGMGPQGSYVVPRAEDISFLREAIAEREHLLFGGREGFARMNLVTGGHVVAYGALSNPDFKAKQYPLMAFSPSFGNWKIGSSTWIPNHGSFVDPSFNPVARRYSTGSDYAINGVSTSDGDISAFVSSNWAVDNHLLSTNVWLIGPMRLSTVCGVYSNIAAGAKVLYRQDGIIGDVTIAQRNEVRYLLSRDKSINGYQYENYEYEDPEGIEHVSTYATGYSVNTDPDFIYSWTNSVNNQASQILMVYSNEKACRLPYTYKINNRYSPKKYKSLKLNPLNFSDYYRHRSLSNSGKIVASGGFLTAATNYVTTASCFLVFRLAVIRTETHEGRTSRAGVTATTNFWVMTNFANANLVSGMANWEIDFDISDGFQPFFDNNWVSSTSWPTVDILNDEDMDSVPQDLYAFHTREIKIEGIDLNVYFHFTPTFHARILDN